MRELGAMAEDLFRLKEFLNINCNLCGGNDYEIYGCEESMAKHIVHRTVVRCKKCGLVYSNPQATREILQDFYNATYPDLSKYLEHVERLKPYHQTFFSSLKERRKRGRFLDIGCATGHLLKVGQEFGWDVYGVELSETFSRYARETLGLRNIFTGELSEAHYPDRFFDYINMWHTIEHVNDPTQVLIEVARIMKDDAELNIGLPNIAEPYHWVERFSSWLKGKTPGMPSSDHHTYHFTHTTLRKMVEKTGLVIDEMRLYYDPGEHDIADGTNWKGKLEKRLIALLARVFRNRMGFKMSARVLKQAGACE
jgi:SAM-dependent methyltransferase